MLLINKGNAPDSLLKYKKEKYAYYNGFKYKDDIRKSLLIEQGYLCAYCMRRISITEMKIEHYIPGEEPTDEGSLEYSNMLGCCKGKIKGVKVGTCDSSRGDTKLTVDPLNQSSIDQITYEKSTGRILSINPDINRDLDVTLNLNSKEHLLKENRKAALNALFSELSKLSSRGKLNARVLEKIRDNYAGVDKYGQKQEYSGIIIWYLNKKLNNKS